MRLRYLLLSAVIGLTFPNVSSAQVTKYLLSTTQDSIKGFDEAYHTAAAMAEGLTGNSFVEYMAGQQRAYINEVYKLGDREGVTPPTMNYFKPLGGGATINNAPCVNEDFESGTSGSFPGWTAYRGRNVNSSAIPTFTASNLSAGAQVSVVSTPFSDPIVGTIPNSPLGGTKVIRLNNTNTGNSGPAIKIKQTFSVTATNYFYNFVYWAVMENAASPPNTPHTCSQTPYMSVRIRDFNDTLQACPNFSFVAPATGSGGCAGTGPATWSAVAGTSSLVLTSVGWQKFSINLSAYMNQNVSVEVTVAHCTLWGHYGYGYFDSNCGTMDALVNGSPVSLLNTIATATALCGNTATIVAPNGLSPYTWNGPTGSGIINNTSQTITTNMAGNYTLNMNPPGLCNQIQKVISLSFVPPTTVTASPATICTSGSNTVSTLSASGATSYTWLPSGSTGSTKTVSPGSTTIYTLIAQTGTCIGQFTTMVTVAPDPNVSISASSSTLCNGGSTTLTANGALTYSWMPGSLTGAQVTVNPGSTTVYTVYGTGAGGCVGTQTITVNVSTTPTVGIFSTTTGTICAGDPVFVIGLGTGITSFSWYPTSPLITGQVVTLNPTITTEYTLVGTNGTCTNSATRWFTVDPGPSMTVTANPTITCPGVNATLTAIAPASLGFTWSPGGATVNPVVVNPLVTTVYSVTGVNASGCHSTYTINKLVAPVPTVAYSPANPTVCIGSVRTITASGGISYTWTPGPVFTNTIAVNPVVNTTYSTTVSNGTCSSTGTVMVTVVPVPTVGASATPTAICRGNSALLQGSGGTTYTWQPNGSFGANAIVSPTQTTTYTLTGNVAGCTDTETVTVVVNPLPTITPVATPTAVCPGFCSTLSATGANTYTFSSGPVVCPTITSTYSVSGTSTAGCVGLTRTVQVVVNPVPAIAFSPANPSICAGGNINVTPTGAISYTWQPGNLVGATQNLSPGSTTIYTVSGTNANGCVGQNTVQVTVVPNPTVTPSASPATLCAGGSSTLSATGAASYIWLPGNIAGSPIVVTPLATTIYTVTGSTAGCSNTRTVSVTVNPRPSVSVSANPASICAGSCSTLTPLGAISYTFLPAGPIVCPTVTTTYSVTGVNAFGCTNLTPATVAVVVNPPASFTLSSSSSSVCSGNSVTLTATGVTSYTWLPGNLSGSPVVVTPTATTTYTAIGSTGAGCTGTNNITIVVVPTPTVTASASPATICPGQSSTLTATGAVSFLWNPGNLSGSPVIVSPGSTTIYTVTGTSSGCSSTRTVVVNTATVPNVTANANPLSICAGNCATLSPSGATSYTWTGLAGINPVVCPTVTTTYTVTGANAAGCTDWDSVTVSVNNPPSISATASTFSICAGGSTTLVATGGNSYTWNPGNTAGNPVTVSPLVTTQYTVTGANLAGCTGTATILITVVPVPVVSVSANPSSICSGASSTLTASGASSYVWSPSGTGSSIVVTPIGTTIYTVVGSTSGCTDSETVQVTVNPVPSLTATASPANICLGGCSTLSATGGTSYTWTPGPFSGASVLVCPTSTQIYTLTGSNAFGCTSTRTVTVTVNNPPALVVSPTTNTICQGGTASLQATGATSYTWLPGNQTSSSIIVTPNATTIYTVIGMSASGCTTSATATVFVNPRPTVSISVAPSNTLCAGSCATLTATGASTYSWSSGSTGSTAVICPASNMSVGVIGTSAAGCQSTITAINLFVNPLPVIGFTATPAVICSGNSSTLTAGGAATYTWNPGNIIGNPIVVSPVSSTIYTVSGTNANGCVGSNTVSILVNPSPTVTIVASSNSVCLGLPIVMTAIGTGSTYNWQPGGMTTQVVTVTPNNTTTYTVTTTNAFGCSRSATITINVIVPPSVTAVSSPTSVCAGGCTTLTANGATSYTWVPGFTSGATAVRCPTATTAYTVVGQTGMCFSFAIVNVPVIPLPTIIASAAPSTICPGAVATLSASGASVYTWMPGNLAGSSVTVSPSSTQVYTVTGANGACTNSATVVVAVSSLPSVSITASSTSICAGGSVTLIGTGASSYSWSPGGSTSSAINVSPSSTTTYTLRGFNALGCSSTATITIFVQPLPTVQISATATNVCTGNCATLTASGANSYTWTWSPVNTSTGSTLQVCPAGPTSYTVVGAVGSCTAASSQMVNVSSGPGTTISASSTTVCPAGSVTLAAISPQATSYSWTPGGSTSSLIVVNPSSTTTYTVRTTNSLGCSSTTTITIQVVPNPVVTIIGTTSLCAGQSTTLQANGATSYFWNPGSLTGNIITVQPSATTVYSVTGNSGGCSGTATHTIIVVPNPVISATVSPQVICSGGTATLSASGGNTYTWQPGTIIGNNVQVSPTGSTIYTVTGANVNGCTSQQTVALSVSPAPVVSVSSSNATICAGSSATLTASGLLSYTWQPINQTGATQVVSPSSTTTYTVFASNGPGCGDTAVFVQYVSPIPNVNVTASSPTVCAGFSVALNATGANNYTFNPGGITNNPAMVFVSSTTTFTVDAESNGCTTQATIVITAVPLPNIQASASPTSVCAGGSAVLSASGASSYTWFPGGQGGSAITVTPATTTQYTLVGFANTGCPNFDTLTVPVLNIPQIIISSPSNSVCSGANGTLTASGALSYTWLPSNTNGPTLVINQTSPATYTVIGDNGACSNDTTITIGVFPLPVVSASVSPTQVCAGLPVTLTAAGANSYTWMPPNLVGSPVVDNPVVSTTYTVSGSDANGCIGQAITHVAVDPAPVLVPVATPTGMCEGSLVTVTLSVTGNAVTYTWQPTGSTQTLLTDNPTSTTIYTVSGTDNIGCIGSNTVMVGVFPIPTLAVSPLNTSVCAGSSATLNASGATNYTWLPSGGNASTAVVTPLSFTTYTVIGDNGGICLDTAMVSVFVNPLPANVSASVSGTITCASPTVQLFGSSTDTNVSYSWSGPQGYSSNDQNPVNVNVWGTFTLSVTDNVTGCTGTATVDVPTDGSIPLVNATTTGSISCSGADVFINAVHTTTNPGYLWTGPQGFSATTQSVNAPIAGDYTIVVTDLTSLCTGSAVVTVGTHTEVTVTASITAATCSAGISLNDGTILVGNFGPLDRFDLVAGTSYTGSLTYTNAITIPVSGIITNNLANPTSTVAYTLRIFDSLGCVKDFVLVLDPIDCTLRPMGIAKSASTPTLNSDGTYKVIYTVTIVNYDSLALTNVLLDENLAGVFPGPTTFTRGALTTPGTALQINEFFDGVNDTKLILSSTIAARDTEYLSFEVNITANGFFGPFSNTVSGTGFNSLNLPIGDTSTDGDSPDPDNDGNPGNNSTSTIVNLKPDVFFGLTKVGSYQLLDNNTYDVSYTVTVHNRGNDTLRNIVVADSLFNNTIKSPASYVVKAGPIATGGLAANSNFDGRFDINLISSGQSKMAPGEISSVSFTLNVAPDTVTVVYNSAFGSAQSFFGDTARDISNAGTNPDSNNNGVWNEPEDNVPTLLELPPLTSRTSSLFIPEGFSPDGDGVNDLFVIKGLPDGGENSITIFNRWGNRVYHHGNYNNSWDGRPNIAGTLGKDKLPPGTYFYVLELKGPGVTKTGYIVLQY